MGDLSVQCREGGRRGGASPTALSCPSWGLLREGRQGGLPRTHTRLYEVLAVAQFKMEPPLAHLGPGALTFLWPMARGTGSRHSVLSQRSGSRPRVATDPERWRLLTCSPLPSWLGDPACDRS